LVRAALYFGGDVGIGVGAPMDCDGVVVAAGIFPQATYVEIFAAD